MVLSASKPFQGLSACSLIVEDGIERQQLLKRIDLKYLKDLLLLISLLSNKGSRQLCRSSRGTRRD